MFHLLLQQQGALGLRNLVHLLAMRESVLSRSIRTAIGAGLRRLRSCHEIVRSRLFTMSTFVDQQRTLLAKTK